MDLHVKLGIERMLSRFYASKHQQHLEKLLVTLEAKRRDEDLRRSLDELEKAVKGGENLMPSIIEAVRCYATIGEICGVMRQKWGEFKAPTYI